MLIELTLQCDENCPHCMVEASPDKTGIDMETMLHACVFLKKVKPPTLQISGGEFTLHNMFYEFVVRISESIPDTLIILESNGSFYKDHNRMEKVLRLLIRKNIVGLQIRTHPDWYPNYEEVWKHKLAIESLSPKIAMYNDGIDVLPMGRAKTNNLAPDCKRKPQCSNVFAISRQLPCNTLTEFVYTLQFRAKNFCKPLIDKDGYIRIGETPQCLSVGHVAEDSPEQVLENIRKSVPCNKCGLVRNYKEVERIIIMNEDFDPNKVYKYDGKD